MFGDGEQGTEKLCETSLTCPVLSTKSDIEPDGIPAGGFSALVFGAGDFDVSVMGSRQYRTVVQLQHGGKHFGAVNMLDAEYRGLSAESNGFVNVCSICSSGIGTIIGVFFSGDEACFISG